jgi:catechol 2,3-dioxygenase-like lactoylglutathione lyase family enzyme
MSVSGIDHVAITVSDVEATVAFYERVLGAEALYVDLWRAGQVPIVVLQVGASRLSVHAASAPASPHARVPTIGGADLCFRWVGPIAAAVERLRALAVAVEAGPVPRPAANGELGESVYFRDPDGNLLELLSIG